MAEFANLTKQEKITLEWISYHAARQYARRALIILMSNEAPRLTEIAHISGVRPKTVQLWQREFGRNRLEIFPPELLHAEERQPVKSRQRAVSATGFGLKRNDALVTTAHKVLEGLLGAVKGWHKRPFPDQILGLNQLTAHLTDSLDLFAECLSAEVATEFERAIALVHYRIDPALSAALYTATYNPQQDDWLRANYEPAVQQAVERYHTLDDWLSAQRVTLTDQAIATQHVLPRLLFSRYEAIWRIHPPRLLTESDVEPLARPLRQFQHSLHVLAELFNPEAEQIITLTDNLAHAVQSYRYHQQLVAYQTEAQANGHPHGQPTPPDLLPDLFAKLNTVWQSWRDPDLRRHLALGVV